MSDLPKLRDQPKWTLEAKSREFESHARSAESYLYKCKDGAKTRNFYKHLHDEHLAKFYLYNYLHGRTFLNSPALLWNELKFRLSNPPEPPYESFEKNRFTEYYLAFVRAEMTSLEE